MADSFKIADAFVEVHADQSHVTGDVRRGLGRLDKDVAADADRAGSGIGSRIASGLSRNLSITRLLSRDLDTAGRSGSVFASTLGSMSTRAGVFGASILAVIPILQQLSGLVGLLPALGFAGGAAIATLVVGMNGFGDAISNMDKPEKFAEAVAKLSPAAREAALAINDLRPAFRDLQLDVQDRLFAGMAATIRDVSSTYLPVLRSGLGGVAESMNRGVREFAGFLTMPGTIGSINTMFDNTRVFLDNLTVGIRPFLQGLTTVGEVGSTFLPQIGAWLSSLAQRFGDFIAQAQQTGQLKAWIQGGLDALSSLWNIITNLWSSVMNLTAVFGGGAGLLGALTAVSAVLSVVTGFIRDNSTWMGPLAAGVLLVVGAIKAWTIAQGVLNAVMMLNPWVAVAAAIIAAVLLIATHWEQVSGWLVGVWNMLRATAATVWNAITSAISSAVSFVVGVVTAIWNAHLAFYRSIWNAIVSTVSSAVNTVRSVVTSVVNAVVSFLSNAWSNARSTAVNAWNGLVSAVRGAVDGMLGFVRSIPGAILGALGSLGSLLYNAGRSIIQGLVNGIKSMVSAVTGAVGSVLSAARNLLPFSPAKEGPFSGKGWTLYSGQSITEALAQGVLSRGAQLSKAVSSVMSRAHRDLSGVLPGAGLMSTPGAVRSSGTDVTTQSGLSDVLERLARTAGVTVNVQQQSGSPAETGRFVALALRTVG